MNFDEYQQAARATAMYPDRGSNLVYPTLGLAGETGEICDKINDGLGKSISVSCQSDDEQRELAKELGDVLWYTALLADELGLKLSQLVSDNNINSFQSVTTCETPYCRQNITEAALCLAGAAGGVCDMVKKMFRDDRGLMTDKRRKAIFVRLGCVLGYVAAMTTEIDESLERIAEMNIEKLASRKRRGTITGDGDNR